MQLQHLDMGCLGCFGFRKSKKAMGIRGRSLWLALTQRHKAEPPSPDQPSSDRPSPNRPSQDKTPSQSSSGETCGAAAPQMSSQGASSATLSVPGRRSSSSERPEHVVIETHHVTQAEDFEGHKMVNQYVRERTLGSGSYGKVVLHRSLENGELYAIKICNKSRLRKLRVAPSETALMDVMREVAIMKQLDHPNVVRLVEVIDDPESDKLYLVLDYVNGGSLFDGSGPPGGIGEDRARHFFRDVVAGLTYLHQHNVVHGDIKPENLLLHGDGHIQISDFGVAHMLEDDSDELRRSPGTPVYTAPECCLGSTYHGKVADIWALGCTLYVALFGAYPFVGHSLASTYDKIVHDPLRLPEGLGADLRDLLRGLLQKDPTQRITLEDLSQHPWVIRGLGPVYQLPFKGISVDDEMIASAFSKSMSVSRH